jgi:DNA-binding CsgD family transcriptional regulator
MPNDALLLQEIVHLYEAEPDLLELPGLLFEGVARLVGADVVSYAEVHHRSGDLRSMLSMDDQPDRREAAFAAYARHAGSHPFWQHDPAFYGERALRESDFFGDEEFMALPMAREVYLPSNARRIMAIMFQHGEYSVQVSAHGVIGRPAFGDAARDRFEAYRPHVLRVYRQAQRRAVARLSPAHRLHYAFPALTPREVEAAVWLTQGKSNAAIAAAMEVSPDTVKAHLKAVFGKVGTHSRLALASLAHATPPFASLPPLWRLSQETWATHVPQARQLP